MGSRRRGQAGGGGDRGHNTQKMVSDRLSGNAWVMSTSSRLDGFNHMQLSRPSASVNSPDFTHVFIVQESNLYGLIFYSLLIYSERMRERMSIEEGQREGEGGNPNPAACGARLGA